MTGNSQLCQCFRITEPPQMLQAADNICCCPGAARSSSARLRGRAVVTLVAAICAWPVRVKRRRGTRRGHLRTPVSACPLLSLRATSSDLFADKTRHFDMYMLCNKADSLWGSGAETGRREVVSQDDLPRNAFISHPRGGHRGHCLLCIVCLLRLPPAPRPLPHLIPRSIPSFPSPLGLPGRDAKLTPSPLPQLDKG